MYKIHGDWKTPLYKCWKAIKERCKNKKSKAYKHYGARGIAICGEWLIYENFKKWALKNGYKDGLEIDRIDVNGNYDPENCKWSTRMEQCNNKNNNIFITIDGEKHTLFEWCRLKNIHYNTVSQRIKNGWSEKDAIFTKVNKSMRNNNVKFYTINGIKKTLFEWCVIFNKGTTTVRKRMKQGMSLTEALGVTDGK